MDDSENDAALKRFLREVQTGRETEFVRACNEYYSVKVDPYDSIQYCSSWQNHVNDMEVIVSFKTPESMVCIVYPPTLLFTLHTRTLHNILFALHYFFCTLFPLFTHHYKHAFRSKDTALRSIISDEGPYHCSTTVRGTAAAFDTLSRCDGYKSASFNAPIEPCLDSNAYSTFLEGMYTGDAQHLIDNDDATVPSTEVGTDSRFIACVLDTGVDIEHPHFKGKGVLIVPPTEKLGDNRRHSTHLCSIIAGNGTITCGGESKRVEGVASRAKAQIIPLQMGKNCMQMTSKLVESFKLEPSYHVLNLSWTLGGPEANPSNLNDMLDTAIGREGKVVVVAAGNPRTQAEREGTERVRTVRPAGHDGVITVGCKAYKYEKEPDLYAPDNWRGAKSRNDDTHDPTQGLTSDCGNYIHYQGSSQAAAFVTGVCLVLLSKCPSFPPKDLKRVLCKTRTSDRMIDPKAAWMEMYKNGSE